MPREGNVLDKNTQTFMSDLHIFITNFYFFKIFIFIFIFTNFFF